MRNVRRLFCLGLFVLSAIAVTPAPAQQQAARVALVIGNANYPDAAAPLPNAVKDVTAVAEEFRRLHFSVDLKKNLRKAEMQRAIDAFIGKIQNDTTALFYFSGFGLQVGRQSYLLPVNAQIWSEADVRRDGVSVDALLAEMHRKGAKAKVVIIDAARRNPFERRFRTVAAGLAPLNAPVSTLVLYSGALNRRVDERSSGDHSLFAAELLKELRSANLTAEAIFNHVRIGVSRASNGAQVPWVASSLLGEIYFGATPSGAPAAAARKGNTAAMHYLGIAYDRGHGVAQNRRLAAEWIFKAIKAGSLFSVKQMTDNPAAYSNQFRRQLQRLLSEAGVYDGAIDGRFGPATSSAVAALAKRAQAAR